jgi:AraC-like DNA-binding protein
MTLDWTDLIAFFTLIQLLFLTFVTFHYKKGKRLSNRILSGFMASNALLIAPFLLNRFHWISPDKLTIMGSIGNSSYLLLMPFLYLYIKSLCYRDFQLKKIYLLHVIPFVFTATFSLVVHFSAWNDTQMETTSSVHQLIAQIENWSHHIILHLQIGTYLIATALMLVSYRKQLKDLYSSIEKIDLSWCNLLLMGFTTMWLIDLLTWILRSFHGTSEFVLYWMLILSLLINLIFTLVVTYKGIVQSEGFSGIRPLSKYATSRLRPSDCDVIVQKLTTYMKKEKPYLTPSLSLDILARELKVPAKHLSQAVHIGMKQNFYDIVNAQRIEEAKERILDEQFRNQTLLAVAYDVGFNSKSVFNAAFKKHTGMTPKEYKRHSDKLPSDSVGTA